MVSQEVVRAELNSKKDCQSVESVYAEEGNAICQLVGLMQSVNVDSSEAKLNATTINDGKGGRILL